MNKPKHTPGPWCALKYPDVKSWTVAAQGSVASKIKTEQDARLIAAAPEMLEALEQIKGLLPDIEGEGPLGTIENIIDHAIAKAEGGSDE